MQKTSVFDLPYAAFLAYSPRGTSPMSKRSREICYRVKAGKSNILANAARLISEHELADSLRRFFGEIAVLVPAPRSSPLVSNDALWPGDKIARALVNARLAEEVQPLLSRRERVSPARRAAPGDRPTVARHLETIDVRDDYRPLWPIQRIVIVDDVVTKGATLYACAALLRQQYPDADIRAFALIRTRGLVPEIDAFIDPCIGTIKRNAWGDTDREP